METHMILQQMMDTLFRSMDLNSWTIHENKSGIVVCSLRFKKACDHVTKQKEVRTPVHFKRKSTSQLQRDRNRMQNFSRPLTRSQVGQEDDIETFRESRNIEHFSDTGPISPEAVSSVDTHIAESVDSDQSSVSSITDHDTHSEVMPECDSAYDTVPVPMPEVHAGDARSSLDPDPPPHVDAEMTDVSKTLEMASDSNTSADELVNSILNKPDEDVTLKDLALVIGAYKY